jgi:hypothetical protein
MLTDEAKKRIVKWLHDSARNQEEKNTLSSWMEHGAAISVPEGNAEALQAVEAMSPGSPALNAEGYDHVFVHASPELRATLLPGFVEIWFMGEFQSRR